MCLAEVTESLLSFSMSLPEVSKLMPKVPMFLVKVPMFVAEAYRCMAEVPMFLLSLSMCVEGFPTFQGSFQNDFKGVLRLFAALAFYRLRRKSV